MMTGEKIHSSFCCPTRRSTARVFIINPEPTVTKAQISFGTQRYSQKTLPAGTTCAELLHFHNLIYRIINY